MITNNKSIKNNKKLIRKFTTKGIDRINEHLHQFNWQYMLSFNFYIEDKYQTFASTMRYLLNKFIPEKTLGKVMKMQYTPEINDLYKRKLNLHYNLKNNPSLKIDYKNTCKRMNKLLKTLYSNHEERIISKGRKSIYKFVRNKLTNNEDIQLLIDESGIIYSKKIEIANKFAQKFQTSFQDRNGNIEQYSVNNEVEINLTDINFSIIRIHEMLRQLPNKNSTSPDGIPFSLLKNCSETIAPVITELFRIILDSGDIPNMENFFHNATA
jgi:hypothetical protein